jgi:hypothetical protein
VDGRFGKFVVVVFVIIPTLTVPAFRDGSRTQIHPSKSLR